jgi:AAHS family 4-hydroxybenzoate transporter-like MFS transporter
MQMDNSILRGRATADSGGTLSNWPIVILTFLAVLFDGYDTTSLGLAVPTLAKQWQVSPAAFTAPLTVTNIGVVIGYLVCGRASARFSRRTVILTGVCLYAVGSVFTALSTNIETMTIVRLIGGVGLGLVLPAAVSFATAHNPGHRREMIAVLVTMGISGGALLGGLTAGRLITSYGWTSMFWVGAVCPALLLPFLWRFLRKETPAPSQHEPKQSQAAGVREIFTGGLAVRTVLLWAFAFLLFAAYYGLSSWVPTFMTGYGFTRTAAPLGVAALGVGGLAGALVVIVCSTRWPTVRVLMVTCVLAAGLMATVATVPLSKAAVLLVFTGIGGGLTAALVGQAGVAASLYPQAARTTGVGWASALGRIGSVIGPALAGLLISVGASAGMIVLLGCVPVILGAGTMAIYSRHKSRNVVNGALVILEQ